MQKGKMVALQIAGKRREDKGKGEKEKHTYLHVKFQRIVRRNKKAFLSDQCKEVEENNRMGKTRDLFKKIRDNHDGAITDLEPDILECEVNCALESITMNKASGGDGIPIELFQILKDDAMKVLHSICQQI